MSDAIGLKPYWKNPSIRFVVLFLVLFFFLYYFNIFYIGITVPGNYYSPFFEQHFNYIRGFRHVLIAISAWVMRTADYQVFTSDTTLHVLNAGGINVVYSCLGFGVMSFFVAFAVAWPEKSLKNKLVFIPAGLMLIQLMNVARFIILTLFWRDSPLRSIIDHHTLFNFILYVILLLIIYFWINSNYKKETSKET